MVTFAVPGPPGRYPELCTYPAMADFPPSTAELLEAFEDFPEWDERYDYLIDLGRELPELPEELKTKEHLVEGCMSTVWLATSGDQADQPLTIQADSDSIIVKGLIVVVLAFYHQMPAAEVATADIGQFLAKLGLDQHLSPQRRNGLFAMIKRLQSLAAATA